MWAFHLGRVGFFDCVNEAEKRIRERVSGLGEGSDSVGFPPDPGLPLVQASLPPRPGLPEQVLEQLGAFQQVTLSPWQCPPLPDPSADCRSHFLLANRTLVGSAQASDSDPRRHVQSSW